MNYFEIAYRLLGQYEAGGKYLNLSLNSHMVDSLSKKDRALLTALLYKTVEKKLTYDYYISAVSKRSVDKITPEALDAIRLGVCALLDMNSIPDHAAVNEAVRLIKRPSERSFVNGVLRGVARQKQALPLPDKKKNAPRYYSVYYSIPLPTVKYMISLLGEESAVGFFESVNSTDFTTSLTVNTQKISVGDFIEKLTLAGQKAKKSELSSLGVIVEGSLDPKEIDGFSEGEFFVQDEASALSALTLGAEQGQLIIDACSAPGGKSFALAILSGDGAQIRSFDIHESKISLIESGAKRLGLNSVVAECRDATDPDASLFEKADRVLCDVPCSGLGVLWKKPDLRYRVMEGRESLPSLQKKILSESASYVASGGTLVYSTCTLRPEENEAVVRDFLASHPEFSLEPFAFGVLSAVEGMLTTYPHLHGMDGFFVAKMRRA